jgi:hypothetical protein
MPDDHSLDELLEFLAHAADQGLMPAATATALAVGARKVFSVMGSDELKDLRTVDVDSAVRRFKNKYAKDFNPSSLKEYARRAKRAQELFLQWRQDPAEFSVKTRAPLPRNKQGVPESASRLAPHFPPQPIESGSAERRAGFQSAFPVRPGHVVYVSNIPEDLTKPEAERLAQFIRLLVAVDG